jgi:hypothetical protein
MNVTSYTTILVTSFFPPQNDKNNNFVITMDPFYIGTFIGLTGAFLVALIRLRYLYYRRQVRLSKTNVVFETHNKVHDIVKTSIELSV